jgi:transcriptional regulator with XRE-family HTH domain
MEPAGLIKAVRARGGRLGRSEVLAYEAGERTPRADKLCALADALGVRVGELIGE